MLRSGTCNEWDVVDVCISTYICELLEEREMLERILGNATKMDKIIKEQRRARLTALFEGIKNSQTEVMAELQLLRKDDAKATFWLSS